MANFNRNWDRIASAPNKKWTFQNYQHLEKLLNFDGKIRHSFNNSFFHFECLFTRNRSPFVAKKELSFKVCFTQIQDKKYRKWNSSLSKKNQILYCLKCVWVAARFVSCLPLHPFLRRRQILDAGNHSVQQICLRLLPYSSCLFCFCGHEGPSNGSVGSQNGRTEVRFDLLHGRKWSLTDCISSRHFCQHSDLGHKSLRCCT